MRPIMLSLEWGEDSVCSKPEHNKEHLFQWFPNLHVMMAPQSSQVSQVLSLWISRNLTKAEEQVGGVTRDILNAPVSVQWGPKASTSKLQPVGRIWCLLETFLFHRVASLCSQSLPNIALASHFRVVAPQQALRPIFWQMVGQCYVWGWLYAKRRSLEEKQSPFEPGTAFSVSSGLQFGNHCTKALQHTFWEPLIYPKLPTCARALRRRNLCTIGYIALPKRSLVSEKQIIGHQISSKEYWMGGKRRNRLLI